MGKRAKQDIGISHPGTVMAVNGNAVIVKIVQVSACSGCQVRNLCRISEMKEKTVQVFVAHPENYLVGQEVTVTGSESQGMKAVLLAFGLPLLILLAVLFAVIGIWNSEKIAVLAAVVVLACYYTVLFLKRDRIGKEFQFSIRD